MHRSYTKPYYVMYDMIESSVQKEGVNRMQGMYNEHVMEHHRSLRLNLSLQALSMPSGVMARPYVDRCNPSTRTLKPTLPNTCVFTQFPRRSQGFL